MMNDDDGEGNKMGKKAATHTKKGKKMNNSLHKHCINLPFCVIWSRQTGMYLKQFKVKSSFCLFYFMWGEKDGKYKAKGRVR